MPEVGDSDILVETRHVGLCGSDVTYFQDYTYGGARPDNKLPIYLGHEVSGVVIDAGKAVSGIKIGDKVALEPSVPCMKCRYCKEGNYNLCENMDMMSAPPFHRFALQKYISHPAGHAFVLPENMDTIEGALVEPFCVGMYAALRGEASAGKSVLVMGTGCIGIMTLLACKAYGVKKLFAVDILDNRIEKAKEIIPDLIAVNPGHDDAVEIIKSFNNGNLMDIVFETAGVPTTLERSVNFVRRGGKIVTVGNVHGKVDFPFIKLNFKEVDLRTVFRYKNLFDVCIETISSGMNVKKLVSKTFPFEKTQEAFSEAVNNKDNVLKIIVEM